MAGSDHDSDVVPNGKYRRPLLISWFIDGVLAIAIMTAVFQFAQFVERLDSILAVVEKLSSRVETLERSPGMLEAGMRMSVVEQRVDQHDQMLDGLKGDLDARLTRFEVRIDRTVSRIEDKLDRQRQ